MGLASEPGLHSSTALKRTASSSPSSDVTLQIVDIIALGGRTEDLTSNMGLIGPGVDDAKALNIPLDQAEVLVTNKAVEGKALKEFRNEDFAGQLQLVRIGRGDAPVPLGTETKLQHLDVLSVFGSKLTLIFGSLTT
jgi:putative transport protein